MPQPGWGMLGPMQTENFIPGKDASLESTINTLQGRLQALGFHIEERSWLNPVEGIWSVHIRDRDCPLLFTNGKGATRLACLASALGELFERLSNNYFWTHYYLGPVVADRHHVHYPQERWFAPNEDGSWPVDLLNPGCTSFTTPRAVSMRAAWSNSTPATSSAAFARCPMCASATVWSPGFRSTSLAICT